MTEDFVTPDSEISKPESDIELPSPFDAVEPPPLPSEDVGAADFETVAPPPLPADVEMEFPDVEPIAPPPAEFVATQALDVEPVPSPQPITLEPSQYVPSDYTAAEQAVPKKSNQTLIIVLIVVGALLLLCCCCVLPIALILMNLDNITYEMGLHLFSLL